MATTDATATEQAAIEQAIQFTSTAPRRVTPRVKGDVSRSGRMLGSIGGQRFDMPIAQMIETLAAQPLDSNGEFSARLTAIEQVGDAATVRLEEDGCWGNISFVDFFTLAKIDGAWKIVNKTFAHTGGEMPTG
jgi:hypothetical protein